MRGRLMSTKLFIDMDGTTCRFHDEVQYLERMFEEGFFKNLNLILPVSPDLKNGLSISTTVQVCLIT